MMAKIRMAKEYEGNDSMMQARIFAGMSRIEPELFV